MSSRQREQTGDDATGTPRTRQIDDFPSITSIESQSIIVITLNPEVALHSLADKRIELSCAERAGATSGLAVIGRMRHLRRVRFRLPGLPKVTPGTSTCFTAVSPMTGASPVRELVLALEKLETFHSP